VAHAERIRACAAFQGWRYLEAKEAPRDLSRAAPGASKMPEQMRRDLREPHPEERRKARLEG